MKRISTKPSSDASAASALKIVQSVYEEYGDRLIDGVCAFLGAVSASDDRKIVLAQIVEDWRRHYHPNEVASNDLIYQFYLKANYFPRGRPAANKRVHLERLCIDYYCRQRSALRVMARQMERRAARYSEQRLNGRHHSEA